MIRAIKGGNIEWKNPLWPKSIFIMQDINGYFLPILLLFESISGRELDRTANEINKNLFCILNNNVINNDINKEKAKWVLNIIF